MGRLLKYVPVAVLCSLIFGVVARSDQGWQDNQDGSNFSLYDVSSLSANNLVSGGSIIAGPTGLIQLGSAPLVSGTTLTYYVDNDNGSDAANGLTSTTPKKTFEGIAAVLPANNGGAGLTIHALPRAGGAAYLKNDNVTNENLQLISPMVGYAFVAIQGDNFTSGSVPSNGYVPATGTNATGYDVVSATANSWTVTLHGGGAPGLSAEPALEGCRWRWDAATTTVPLRNQVTTILGNTSTSVTGSEAQAATPTAGDWGHIEQPGVVIGANVSLNGINIASLSISGIKFAGNLTVSNAKTTVTLTDVFDGDPSSLAGVVALNGVPTVNVARGLYVVLNTANTIQTTIGQVAFTSANVQMVGLFGLSRFYGNQIALLGNVGNASPALTPNIGDVTGTTTNTPSRLVTKPGFSLYMLRISYANAWIGDVNFELNTNNFFYPIQFIGNGNSLVIDGITEDNTSFALAGIIDMGQWFSPLSLAPRNNQISFGPNQASIAMAMTFGDADIVFPATNDGVVQQYFMNLDSLTHVGSLVDGFGNKYVSTESSGSSQSASVLTQANWSDTTPFPSVNDKGAYRVVRAKTAAPAFVDLADSSSTANSAGIVGVNLASQNPNTNFDRVGSALLVTSGMVPILTQDTSPTVPGPVWLSSGYPRGLVTTTKPASDAVQIGTVLEDLGSYTQNLQPQAPPDPSTVVGRLLRVSLGPLMNPTVAGDVTGTLGSTSVVGITDSGGTDLAIGAISSGQCLQRSGSSVVGTTCGTGTVTSVSGTAPVVCTPSTPNPTCSLTFGNGLSNVSGTLSNDLHTGVSGGQTAVGGTAASNNLKLSSTTNATKGFIQLGTNANGGPLLEAFEGANPGVYITDQATIPSYLPSSSYVFSVSSGQSFAGLDFNDTAAGGTPFITLRRQGTQQYTITADASGPIMSFRPGTAAGGIALSLLANRDVQVGDGSGISTAATGGFFLEPSSAGVPTGVPANSTSASVSTEYDRTDFRNYVYSFSQSRWLPAGQYNNYTGLVCSTSTTGVEHQCTAGTDYQTPITWPPAGEVLVSTGTSTTPTGSANFAYSTGTTGVAVSGDRFQYGKGASIASANNLTLGTDGNYFAVTGTTTIGCITTTNWQTGAFVTLELSPAVGVTELATCTGSTAPIILDGLASIPGRSTTYYLDLTYNGTDWVQPSTYASTGVFVPTTRDVNTTDGTLTGGGNLANDLTLARAAITGDVSIPAASNAATLANSGAGAGSCTFCSVQFDSKGREVTYSSNTTAGGDLAGTYPNPTVVAIHETSGPTRLPIGAIASGQQLYDVSGTIAGITPHTSIPFQLAYVTNVTTSSLTAGQRYYFSTATSPSLGGSPWEYPQGQTIFSGADVAVQSVYLICNIISTAVTGGGTYDICISDDGVVIGCITGLANTSGEAASGEIPVASPASTDTFGLELDYGSGTVTSLVASWTCRLLGAN